MTHLLDGIENVRLAVLVTVRTDTEVDLARVSIRLERLGDTYGKHASALPRIFPHTPQVVQCRV